MGEMRKSVIFSSLIFILVSQFLVLHVFPLESKENTNGAPRYFLAPEPEISDFVPVFQKGLSFSAWSSDAFETSESDESLALLTETKTEWIAVCLSWAQSNTTSHDIRPDPNRTPTIDSVRHAITVAHSLGLKVMLKPMVDTLEDEKTQGYSTVWRGEIQPSNAWFESYSEFINFFAKFAQQNGVELFCVGCEFKATTGETEQWKNVISGVRDYYSGPLTYAADWTNYQNIEWWDSLNYVGIDAYFPLSLFKTDPTFNELKTVWTHRADDIEEWLSDVNKPIIFTEIGYRSGDGTNMAPSNYWSDMDVDLQEQSECYEAAFQVLWKRNWFSGFYWWTWIHDPSIGGVNDSYHTPQNKPAQNVITEWYTMDRRVAIVDQSFTSTEKCNINEVQSVGFHVCWENNGNSVADVRVFVNGTEYLTNSSGWARFTVSYDSVGKQEWVITNIEHPQVTSYKITHEIPSIIWDKIIIDVEVDSLMLGLLKLRIRLTYAFDDIPVTGATTIMNGEDCQEVEPGVYITEIATWNPYTEYTLQTDIQDLRGENWVTSTFHVMNIILYFLLIVVIIVIIGVYLKLRDHDPSQSIEEMN